MSQSIENTIQRRISGKGQGWVFSERDFVDVAGRSTVASALHRLEKKGKIRPIIRGLYEYPKYSEVLGRELSADIDQVAKALERKFGWRIQPGGAMAANLLALSTQVPARAVYLSDGPGRSYKVGNRTLVFEHTALKDARFKLRESGLAVHALKFLGQKRITPSVIEKLRRVFSPAIQKKILADTTTATGWVRAAIQEMSNGKAADAESR
ncbi:MAG: DUF6088 family protein [Bryobacteraceae bacterium]